MIRSIILTLPSLSPQETTNPYARAALQLSRTVTAPGRLQVEDGPPAPDGGNEEPKLEQKTVSFFFADENSNPNTGTDTPVSRGHQSKQDINISQIIQFVYP